MEILQLLISRRCSLANTPRLWTLAEIDQLPDWRPSHTNLILFSSQTDLQLTTAQSKSQSQSYFTTGGLPSLSSSWRQSLETHDQYFFFQLNTCGYGPYVTFSLTRGWVCRIQFLLVLASAFILGSESRGTHDHILLSEIRYFPNLEGQVPVFVSPRNRVARL
jgi:hypothetical protein